MTDRLVVIEDPSAEDRAVIVAPLARHNERSGPPNRTATVAILLKNEAGKAVGGLWGRTLYDWLFVELLAVPEELRGQDHGTALMERAEAWARARGCVGIWLDTFSFQARGFYEKIGYAVFGTIADNPVGGARYFLQKKL